MADRTDGYGQPGLGGDEVRRDGFGVAFVGHGVGPTFPKMPRVIRSTWLPGEKQPTDRTLGFEVPCIGRPYRGRPGFKSWERPLTHNDCQFGRTISSRRCGQR